MKIFVLLAKSTLSIILFTVLLVSAFAAPASAAYQIRLQSSSVNTGATTSSTVKVYEKNGTVYAPLKDTVKKLGYSLGHTIEEELYTYHKYTVTHGDQAAIFWGNEDNGYMIESYALSQGSTSDNHKVYEPAMRCEPETDMCELVTSKYKGPVVHDGTLYVPVRQLAEALSLDLKISKSNGTSIISLTESKVGVKPSM